jgi:hypothetical protein
MFRRENLALSHDVKCLEGKKNKWTFQCKEGEKMTLAHGFKCLEGEKLALSHDVK